MKYDPTEGGRRPLVFRGIPLQISLSVAWANVAEVNAAHEGDTREEYLSKLLESRMPYEVLASSIEEDARGWTRKSKKRQKW